MSGPARGVLAALACYVIWGVSPLFYKLLADVGPLEVMAHRTLWSFVAFGLVLAAAGRLGAVVAVLRAHPWRTLAAGTAIGVNWFLFIYAVAIGETVQSALGYYLLPIAAAVAGRLLFGEALGPMRWAALGSAALGVAILGAGAGGVPWLALSLTATFLLYSILKKNAAEDPVVTVLAEALVLLPPAAAILAALHLGWTPTLGAAAPAAWSLPAPAWAAFGASAAVSLTLAAAGPMTAIPLLLFSYGARRVDLGTVGFLIYLNSTLQFLCAVLVLGEPFGPRDLAGFGAIWLAVALFVAGGRRRARVFPARSGV